MSRTAETIRNLREHFDNESHRRYNFSLCIQLVEVTKRPFRRDVDMKDGMVISSQGFSLAPTALLEYY